MLDIMHLLKVTFRIHDQSLERLVFNSTQTSPKTLLVKMTKM